MIDYRYSVLGMVAACLLSASPAGGDELLLHGGWLRSVSQPGASYTWHIEYLKHLSGPIGLGLSYMNEGHVPYHHRDGISAQAWLTTPRIGRRLTLAIGAGPYLYFDTGSGEPGSGYTNKHGVGSIFSVATTWHTDSRWLVQLHSDWVETWNNIDTFSTVIGVGYQLDSQPSVADATTQLPGTAQSPANEISLLLGRTIVNSFASEHSTAMGIEYRRAITDVLEGSIGFLHEGDNRLVRRNGLTLQLWARRSLANDLASIGVGVGSYLAVDRYHRQPVAEGGNEALSAIISLSGSLRVVEPLHLRFSWNRIVTSYDKDTDVIVAGVGYRF